MSAQAQEKVGVVLMSFGTAASVEEVPEFLTRIRGAPVSDEIVAEMQRRYRRIGGSPLTRITRDQAAALESRLNANGLGSSYRVAVGMRHAEPYVARAFQELAAEGVQRVVAVILSPQHSPILMGGYHQAVADAKRALPPGTPVQVAQPWHLLPSYVEALAQRVREALKAAPDHERDQLPILMTAHSMPKSVVEKEPEYIGMLTDTAAAVARQAGLADHRWRLAYQSAGHAPVEWLTPDIKDLFPGLRTAGHRWVLIVPVQFLADHLELLYDIDVAAKEQAAEAGLELYRTEAFNTMPAFIEVLADVVHRELEHVPMTQMEDTPRPAA